MIRACIFDLGGTIVDKYSRTPFLSLKDTFRNIKINVPNDLIYKDMGLSKQEHIMNILNDPIISSDFKKIYHKNPGFEEGLQVYKLFDQIQQNTSKTIDIIPETKDTISFLKENNILIGVTTGFNKETTNIIKEKLEKNDIFIDKYVSSTCLNLPTRPYPHMINSIMDEFKIDNPKQVIKIDDTKIGIKEGKMAKCWTVGVTRWSNNMFVKDIYDEPKEYELIQRIRRSRSILREENPDYIINTIDELPKIIDILGYYKKYNIK